MSRILDALKKAVSQPRTSDPPQESQLPKPLIFEKIDLKSPSSESVRREVESKKESARLRYLLNEKAPRFSWNPYTRRMLWVAGIGIFIAFFAFEYGSRASSRMAVQSGRELSELRSRVTDLEGQLTKKNIEVRGLKAAVEAAALPDETSELESLRDEVRRLNRRLAIMLQDNLEKDQEIARLSGR